MSVNSKSLTGHTLTSIGEALEEYLDNLPNDLYCAFNMQ